MACTNTSIVSAAPEADGRDVTNTSKASMKRLRGSSEVYEKAAAASPSPKARKNTRGSASANVPAAANAASDATPAQPRQRKAAAVEALLTREGGASLEALCNATGWRPHTCRAFLTGLRKKGREVIRASDKDGKSIYLIATERSPASSSAVAQTGAETK